MLDVEQEENATEEKSTSTGIFCIPVNLFTAKCAVNYAVAKQLILYSFSWEKAQIGLKALMP